MARDRDKPAPLEQIRNVPAEFSYPSRAEIVAAREKIKLIWDGGPDYAALLMKPFIEQARQAAADPVAAAQLGCLGYKLGGSVERGVKRSAKGRYRWPDDIRPDARKAIGAVIRGAEYALENHPEPEPRYRRRFAGHALKRIFRPDGAGEQERIRAIGWWDFFSEHGTGGRSGPAWADWEAFRSGEN